MKKKFLLSLIFFLLFGRLMAQSTETFETETTGSSSFTDSGKVFNITSQAPATFDVFNYTNGGWNGTAKDNKFIDNSGTTFFNTPVEFTISAAGGSAFTLKKFYLFLSKSDLGLSVSGTLTITGKLGGAEIFAATASSPFNTSMGVNNGFTLIDMVNFGGANNSNTSIDQFVITTTGNIAYVALDAMTWQCPSVTVNPVAQTNIACNGGATGAATVSASGGNGFSYDWTPGNPAGDGTATATGLTAGTWTCTVTNSCGLSSSTSFTIAQPATALTATQSQTDVTCNGGSNGTASVVASGGTGAYTYQWSPTGGTAATASGRTAGSYTVTITDANGCSIQKDFTINAPAPLTATQSQTDVTCNGGSNGTASVVASGGTGAYTYQWSPSGGTAATASGRTAGSYTVTITDANGCSIQKNFTINAPSALTATQSQTDVTCNGGSNGTASVVVSGGTGAYTYLWSPNGGTAATASGRTAGSYTVTITDANGCSIQKNFTISAPSALTATQSQTDISCNGGSNGTASVVASGGTGAYTYLWSPAGGTAATATGLSEGSYTVTITDANSCSIQKNFTIGNVADCSIATLWDGTSWSNGVPDCNSYAATINGDYDSALNGVITACSLTVSDGDVTVASGDNFIIKGMVTVSGGTLTFEQDSYLVQSDDVANSGAIVYKRNSSSLYSLDYTLWSSPTSGTQSLKDFSTGTLDANFFVYNTELSAYSNYLSASGIFGGNPSTVGFTPGKGYLVRMPAGLPAGSTSVFNGVFQGIPNNGDVSIALSNQGGRFNAVGNPYPSPISIRDFIDANQAQMDNGTLYFWRKTNLAQTATYVTVTNMGSAAVDQPLDSSGSFTGDPSTWVIQSGQGFLFKASTTATGLVFNNAMRRASGNGQFFRPGVTTMDTPVGELSRLWLDITNSGTSYGQTVIGYSDVTTNGLDFGWDGRLYNDSDLSVYTKADNAKLAIQARASFTENDAVPLSYKANNAGTFTLKMSQYDGLFAGDQQVYLKDNVFNIYHDLKAGAYTFSSEAGTFEDRFEVVYMNAALGTDNPVFDANNVILYKEGNTLKIDAGKVSMKQVDIFDIRGRLLHSTTNVNATKLAISDLMIAQQVLIVQVTREDNSRTSKKIIY